MNSAPATRWMQTVGGSPVVVDSPTVDRVAAVEAIAEDTITEAPSEMSGVKSDLLKKVAHRGHDHGTVFLVDAEALLGGHG